MAKKQSSKKKLPKKSGGLSVFWNKHWQVILIAVLVFGILGFIGVNRLIIYNQKRQFDQAEKSLDTLYANIVKDVGQPTSMTKDKSCSYASTEGGRGRRSCGVVLYAYYNEIRSGSAASIMAASIERTLKNTGSVNILRDIKINNNGFVKSDDYDSSDDFTFQNQNIKCYISYVLNKSATYSDSSSFRVSLGCFADSLAEFYPVKN